MHFVARVALRPLPKEKAGNKFLVVVMNRYSKLLRENSTKETTATDVERCFAEDKAMLNGISDRLLTENGPQFVGNVLNAIRGVGYKIYNDNGLLPPSQWQAQRHNPMIIS